MTNLSSTANDLFSQGFNCSQAVFASFASEFSLSSEVALKLAAPFGAGMGRMCEVCGAVSGALMVIGMRSGFSLPRDEEAKRTTYSLVQNFAERFKERNGSIVCHELLGLRIDTPEGLDEMRKLGLSQTKCANFVRDAIELLHF